MYPVFLVLHSLVRWAVVILAVATVARAFVGWLGKKDWTPLDDRLGMLFGASVDVQLLLGLILYFFLSPLTLAALKNFSAAMSSSGLRFFAVEHVFMMVIGLVLAHVGRVLSKKATEAVSRHRVAAIVYGLAVLAILVAIPWPFMAAGAGRPWIRLG